MPDDESAKTLDPQVRPRLTKKARLVQDRVSGEPLLLYPEGVLRLNATAGAIIGLCDGRRTLAEVVAELGSRYAVLPEAIRSEVQELLNRLHGCGLVAGLTSGLPNNTSTSQLAAPASVEASLAGAAGW